MGFPSPDVLAAFDLPKDCTLERHSSGRFLFKVHGTDNAMLLKRFWRLSPERAAVLEQVLSTCSEVNVTPTCRRTRNGTIIYSEGNEYFSLFSLVPEAPAPQNGLKLAARTIATMHKVLETIDTPEILPPLFVHAPDRKRLLRSAGYDEFIPLLQAADEMKSRVPVQLVHNDLHEGNILFSDKSECWIIDLESFSHNPVVADALFAAFRLTNGDLEKVKEFMGHYEKERPLNSEEKQHGTLLLAADFIRKLTFILKEKEQENTEFLSDLDKYLGFARTVSRWITQDTLPFP